MAGRWKATDFGDFRISSGSGESVMLRFRSTPDYENPADMGGDNTYEVTLMATDGTDTAAQRRDCHGHQRGGSPEQ